MHTRIIQHHGFCYRISLFNTHTRTHRHRCCRSQNIKKKIAIYEQQTIEKKR